MQRIYESVVAAAGICSLIESNSLLEDAITNEAPRTSRVKVFRYVEDRHIGLFVIRIMASLVFSAFISVLNASACCMALSLPIGAAALSAWLKLGCAS